MPLLDEADVLTRIDGRALGRYCQLWVLWRKAEEHVRQQGVTYEAVNKAGATYRATSPKFRAMNALATHLAKLEAEFGTLPGSRSRIAVAPRPEPVDPVKAGYLRL